MRAQKFSANEPVNQGAKQPTCAKTIGDTLGGCMAMIALVMVENCNHALALMDHP